MKLLRITSLFFLCAAGGFPGQACLNAQSTYTFASYASNADTVFLTQASQGAFDFDTSGAGITWNYAALSGNLQRQLRFRLPSQTGFTTFQWPYINNASNVNLSSTDDKTLMVGTIQYTDLNDYFLGNSQSLAQKRSHPNSS